MKILIQNSISLIFGLYFLIAGTGFNVVNYCCNLCEKEGVEAVIIESKHIQRDHEMSCCNDDLSSEKTCDNLQHHSNSCHLTRYSVEISPISSILELKTATDFQLILFLNVQNRISEVLNNNIDSEFELPPPDKKLLKKGRDILTTNAILLI
ncbi:MAG: hypothetical protein PHS59_13505 [Paludibacter sp.]|nr:hypothetical protein [Paludibacter sp.]